MRAEVRAERFLELCVRCACVRLVFGRAMCDSTFAHFFEQKDKIFYYRMSFPVLERPFPVLERSFPVFKHNFPVFKCPFSCF